MATRCHTVSEQQDLKLLTINHKLITVFTTLLKQSSITCTKNIILRVSLRDLSKIVTYTFCSSDFTEFSFPPQILAVPQIAVQPDWP